MINEDTKKIEFLKLLGCSTMLAVLFTSSTFLTDLISGGIIAFIYTGFIVVIYTGIIISSKGRKVLLKWLLSIPISFICTQYFVQTHYAVRAVNWRYPEYGEVTGGAAAADGFLILLKMQFCLIGIVAAFMCSGTIKPEQYEKLERIQLKYGTILSVIHVVIVMILETQFPSMRSLMG
ncbi:MAG: hypothetical protein ACI4AQ_01670 [Lachnospiraceae bacterium]